MRVMIFPLFLAFLSVCLPSSSAIDRRRQLVNRPSEQTMISRLRRKTFLPTYIKYFKEPDVSVKGAPSPAPSAASLGQRVRKGEYVCGDRICRLRAGEEPPNCLGLCQYPV